MAKRVGYLLLIVLAMLFAYSLGYNNGWIGKESHDRTIRAAQGAPHSDPP